MPLIYQTQPDFTMRFLEVIEIKVFRVILLFTLQTRDNKGFIIETGSVCKWEWIGALSSLGRGEGEEEGVG